MPTGMIWVVLAQIEAAEMSANHSGASEPLRCFVSGAAGTGKSQVGKDILELFKKLG